MSQCNIPDWIADDIAFCPDMNCENTACRRNQKNFKCPEAWHSIFTEVPDDCPNIKDSQPEQAL